MIYLGVAGDAFVTDLRKSKRRRLLHVAEFSFIAGSGDRSHVWISNLRRLVCPHCSGGSVKDPCICAHSCGCSVLSIGDIPEVSV